MKLSIPYKSIPTCVWYQKMLRRYECETEFDTHNDRYGYVHTYLCVDNERGERKQKV